MELHYPSLMFFSSLVSFLIVILFISFIVFTKTYKLNIIIFTIGRALVVIGAIGISLRDKIPDFISLTLSNVIILCGTGAIILGVLSFNNKTILKKMAWVFTGIIASSSILYIIFIDSFPHRSSIIFLSLSLMTIIGSVNLFLNRETYKFPIFISAVLLIYGLARAVFALQHLGLSDSFNPMYNDTMSQLFVPFFSIMSLAISVGFILLLREVDVQIIDNNNIELERSNANKDKLIRIIAHDLRTPFNSILGYSELLVESTKKDPFEEIQNFASKIHQNAQKAYQSTNDLLEWVLSNTDNISPKLKTYLVSDLIKEVTSEFTDSLKVKSINIKEEIPKNLYGVFDKNMIFSILRNLLSNAIKFSYLNSSIKLIVNKTDHKLVFSISDEGAGITAEHLELIYTDGKKASTIGTQGEVGSGFGLSICQELIRKHKGEFEIKSSPKKGSTFSFSIPQG